MKIYILPCANKFQPDKPICYPEHSNGYEVEQDFLQFLEQNQEMVTLDHADADWHYLPVYWTRWHVHHNYGKDGLAELQLEASKQIIDDSKTFTICQYDDGPLVDIGGTTVFLSSRNSKEGIDIPLLCFPHKKPFFRPSRKYLASFVGRLSTHPIRNEMFKELGDREDVFILDGHKGTDYFINKTLRSYIALCPRGYGGSSFRLFEAMNLGIPPFLISDIDTRPFKKWINWDEMSLYASTAIEANGMLGAYSTKELKEMGRLALKTYKESLAFQKWCSYVVLELGGLK